MKSKTTYIWLCALGGLIGVHQFYMGNFGKGLFYMFTGGGFIFGFLSDLFNAGRNVDQYNTSRGFVNASARNG
jgi:TM2 domain-containing membrane protein YozV